MATAAQPIQLPLPLPRHHYLIIGNRHLSVHQSPSFPRCSCYSSLLSTREQHLRPNLPMLPHKFQISCVGGNRGDGVGQGSGRGGKGGSGGWNGREENSDNSSWLWVGPIGAFLNGWRSRVAADPQFPFKVLMEELVGVSACVVGDMASRPNFGLNELDFVFSTLVVGSILNFVLMYLLAPTVSASTPSLPTIFASCPPSHMFEPGPYGLLSRFGTFVYKGALFAAVGFAAGLVGTAISNGLIKMRKKMDPNFETPNKPPPVLLNAGTWAIHMGVSSNLRYQTLNGLEFC
ncbi:hypothetical protein NMG60_11000025 [Bertholletia excelsa]